MTATSRPELRATAAPASRARRRTARLGLMAGAAAFAVIVAACTGNAAGAPPMFTYAPPAPSAPAMPGMDMSPSAGAPAPSAAPASAGPASAAPVAPGSPVAAGAALHIAAQNIAFDTGHLDAPAGQAFVLEFANNDPGIPHNVEIKDTTGASVFKGQIITGPAKASYQVPALPAGSYMFLCDVHPNMTGTLTVA